MEVLIIYTDGGAHNEGGDMHGVGAYAFLQTVDLSVGYVDVYTKYVADTTNNRTEMLAVLEGIKYFGGDDKIVEIFSDSGYVVRGYNDPAYLDKWKQNGWKTSTKKPVLNQDLWERFLSIPWQTKFHLNLIKGHKKDSNPVHAFWNDICDQVCTYAMNGLRDINGTCVVRYHFDTKSIEIVELPQVWRFTFGSDHAHPGCCQPIIGTFSLARKKMFELYGDKWCMQYSETQWKEIEANPKRFWSMEEELEVIEA